VVRISTVNMPSFARRIVRTVAIFDQVEMRVIDIDIMWSVVKVGECS
jgi:hypothetical protein